MPRFRRTLSLVVGAILLLITAGVFERRLCVGGACFLSPDEHAGEAHKLELRSPKGSEIAVKGIDEIRNLAGKARKAADRDRKRHDESRRKKKAAKKEPDAPPPPMPGPLKAPSNLIEIEGAKPEKKDRAQKKSSGKPAPSSKPLSTDMMRSHDLQAPFVDRKLDSESEIPKNRPNACIVTLARNSDLPGVMHSIEQFEAMSNSRFRYPYVFLNDKPFTSDFVEAVRDTIASSRGVDPTDVRDGIDIEFGLVPVEHWSYPYWINLTIADQWRQDMQRSGVIYGGSESYRHMCRFFSGYFFRHPLLQKYKWYMRLEPDVDFYCELDYDIFEYMERNGKRYGFNMIMKEIPETVPSLWPLSLHFAKYRKINSTLLRFFVDPKTLDYNMCHFWSNFEVADLDLWRSDEYLDYFDYLDKWGGFFYERWGDAPVHSIAVGLFLEKDEVHFFDEIGYRHSVNSRCPKDRSRCNCPPKLRNFDYAQGSCLAAWNRYEPVPFLPSPPRV